ncbi:MAG: ATP-dependent helicase HrpB [Thermodesulfobacteriota bacterium]
MTTLPIHDILPELRTALTQQPAVVVAAPPGSGKTTVVPPALLDEPWLRGQKIIMLEPRRLAARLTASFMASQRGEAVGQAIGYRVRFEQQVSPATRVEVVTAGLFIRRLQEEPELSGVGLVIFDEFHERSLDLDLALALCLDASQLRDDLRLLVMSATLDTAAVSRLLNNAPVMEAHGRSYPVEVAYLPPPATFPLEPAPREIADQMATAVRKALREQPGDLLAFLPGTGEIIRTAELLASAPEAAGVAILPLHGDLPLGAQSQAVAPDPGGRRRVILATPIAETSLTIEGISTVIDSGWRRAPRFQAESGLTRLTLQRISKASAAQRAGRAGRLGPGHCYRLWREEVGHGLREFDPPEILDADLAQLVLELARWGVSDPAALRWLDPPPAGHLAQARELLQGLDTVDDHGRITDLGRRMTMLPVHPRLAHLLLAGAAAGNGALACDLAALLSERDILKDRDRSADLDDRLHALNAFRKKGAAAVRALGGDPGGCRRVEQVSRQLRQLLPKVAVKIGSPMDPGSLVAAAYPDRIAQRRPGQPRHYKLATGRAAKLADHDRLALHEYLAVASLDAGKSEGRIFLAAPLDLAGLKEAMGTRIEIREEVAWDDAAGTVTALRQRRLGALVLESRPLAKPHPEAIQAAMVAGIARLGLEALPWSEAARGLQARIESLRRWQPEAEWPDLSDAHLAATVNDWLGPALTAIRSREQLGRLDLHAILLGLLPWEKQRSLDQLAPTHLTVPSGSRVRLQYHADGSAPVLAVRLQELFGLAETPTVADGRIPVVLHLLSPARRPIQITQDLKGFWNSAYHEVKKELKGRYPKHHWPDDPWVAQPTSRAKPRK